MKKEAKSNKQFYEGECLALTYEGFGVLKDEGEVLFVPNMFPGDKGKVEFAYKRAGQLYGNLVELKEPSRDRIKPLCSICDICGGCQFQRYSYEAELRHKTDLVKDQFRKVGHMDVDVLPCLGMDEPTHYRNKIQMNFGLDEKGRVYCGYYKSNSHIVIPVNECFIEDKMAKPILKEISSLMDELHIAPYDERTGYGDIKHVMIRTSRKDDEAMVVIVTKGKNFKNKDIFAKKLKDRCKKIATVVQNINPVETNVILGKANITLLGKGFLEDSLCGLLFKVSPHSFFQTNPTMTEILYSKAIEAAHLSKEDIVFDAYSGVGTIGLIASKECKEVISVEIVPEAVKDGILNAKRNNISNFKMYQDDASSFMVRMAKANERVDVLFMDPPRKGSDERFLNALLKLKPKRVVYVSCNPSTLAKDVACISKSYQIDSIQPVDMFPRSAHVEIIVGLILKK